MSVRKQLCIVIVLLSAALMALQAHLYFLGGSTTTADAAKAAADPESASALPGTHVPSAEAAIAWVRQYGGEVNVAIRRLPDKGRATIAARDMQPGDVLIRIPVELAYIANHTWEKRNEAAGAQLLADMATKSFWRPLFSALPSKSEVFNHLSIPQAYFPILQDPATVKVLLWSREYVQSFREKALPTYQQLGLNFSLADGVYGAQLMITRNFQYRGKKVMLPVIDQTNHDNACKHTHRMEPCEPVKGLEQWQQGLTPPATPATFGAGFPAGARSDSSTVSGVCITWRAETPVLRGQEVFNTYGTMTNDRSFLQYGFLQRGDAIEQALHSMDRPDRPAGFAGVWWVPAAEWGQALPHPFAGTTKKELWQEIGRLTARLAKLKQGDAALAAIAPDATADPGGKILALMHTWRRQRLRAIELEVKNLTQRANKVAVDTE